MIHGRHGEIGDSIGVLRSPSSPINGPLGLAIALVAATLTQIPTSAQIVPDATLGVERSRVAPMPTRRGLVDGIEGGTIRGSTLFHSFESFNVNEGQRVYFANPSGIDTILSRVTGNDVSDNQCQLRYRTPGRGCHRSDRR